MLHHDSGNLQVDKHVKASLCQQTDFWCYSVPSWCQTRKAVIMDVFDNISSDCNFSCEATRQDSNGTGNNSALQVIAVAQAATYGILFFLTISLNSFVSFLIVWQKSLHQRTFYLALQMIVANLLQAFVLFSTNFISAVLDRWVFGEDLCVVVGFFIFWMQTSRWILMFLLTLDRFLTVFSPFHYPKHSLKIMVVLSVIAWKGTLVLTLVPIGGALRCYSYSPFVKGCLIEVVEGENQSCLYYGIVYVAIVNCFGGVAPMVMYLLLFRKARQLNRRVLPVGQRSTEHSQRNVTIKKKDRRAAVTVFLFFLNLLGLSFPLNILLTVTIILQDAGIVLPTVPAAIVLHIARTVYLLLLVADPLTVMRNKDFRLVLQQMKYRLCGNPAEQNSVGSV